MTCFIVSTLYSLAVFVTIVFGTEIVMDAICSRASEFKTRGEADYE